MPGWSVLSDDWFVAAQRGRDIRVNPLAADPASTSAPTLFSEIGLASCETRLNGWHRAPLKLAELGVAIMVSRALNACFSSVDPGNKGIGSLEQCRGALGSRTVSSPTSVRWPCMYAWCLAWVQVSKRGFNSYSADIGRDCVAKAASCLRCDAVLAASVERLSAKGVMAELNQYCFNFNPEAEPLVDAISPPYCM